MLKTNNRIVLFALQELNFRFSKWLDKSIHYLVSLPLGILSLAAYIGQQNPVLTPLFLDYHFTDLKEINKRIVFR